MLLRLLNRSGRQVYRPAGGAVNSIMDYPATGVYAPHYPPTPNYHTRDRGCGLMVWSRVIARTRGQVGLFVMLGLEAE